MISSDTPHPLTVQEELVFGKVLIPRKEYESLKAVRDKFRAYAFHRSRCHACGFDGWGDCDGARLLYDEAEAALGVEDG